MPTNINTWTGADNIIYKECASLDIINIINVLYNSVLL